MTQQFSKELAKDLLYIKGRIGWKGLKKSEFTSEGPYLITGVHFKGLGKINWDNCFHITQMRYEESPEIMIDEQDILFTKDGTIGKLAFIDYLPGPASLNSHLLVLRVLDRNKIIPKYIYYFLQSKKFKDYIELNKSGSTLEGLSQSSFEKFVIEYPHIKEQQKIASILSTVDEQIDETEQLIVKTKELKKGLMQQLLTKGIGHTKFKQTELGKIPIEWNVKPIKEVAEIVSGGTPSKSIKSYWENGEILWATPTDITKNRGKYIDRTELCITQLGLEKSSARLLPPGTILMTSRATIGERSIAKTFISTNQGFKSFICKDDLNNEYMYYALEFLKPYFLVNASGSTFLEISKATTENQLMLIPSIKEQIKIASILSTVDKQIETYEEKKAKYEELKKGLMQQLLTGQIRVKC